MFNVNDVSSRPAHPVPLLRSHGQIFSDNLPKTILFFMSSWQTIIRIVDQQSPRSSLTSIIRVEGFLLLEWSFTSSTPPFEPLVPLKNMIVCHHVISIHFLKHFICFERIFSSLNQRFQVYSLLDVQGSFLSSLSWTISLPRYVRL